MPSTMTLRVFGAIALALALFAATPSPHATRKPHASPPPAATIAPIPTESPDVLLARIRNRFRSHRPPPPFEIYTIERKQPTTYGEPDYANTYIDHVWYRSNDHAAFERRENPENGYVGDPRFDRPIFNAATDPGPPTADVFEPAPAHTLPPDFVPTPEPTNEPKILVTIRVKGEFDYRVESIDREGDLLHFKIQPRRQPDRNRLRELWVDAKTLELRKMVATDKLFVPGEKPFPVLFTTDFSTLSGIPVITHIHGVVGGGYDGDGQTIDYDFRDLSFPLELPAWYFNARSWAQNKAEWPDNP
jgi:hypothetical protein